ncbi:hypothetical protein [Streptomyces nitrosporeus]|uniref:hypothetical protein n=1 Tax=Streptomyces nitrosporeus TaxID=28894 RepID=UPI0039A16A9F
MGGPGRPRKLKGGPRANELAEFLIDLGALRGWRTASFAARFPGSSTLWAEYLNGSKIVPAQVLGQVVSELCGTDSRLLKQKLIRAQQLHKDASAEAARPISAAGQEPQVAARELINTQQHLVETQDRLTRATEIAERARTTITTLLMMYGRVETSVRELTHQRDRSHALMREETEARLDKARLRLERTEAELERARQHRYTAEQAQRALFIEAEEARRELEELRRRAADLGHDGENTDSPERNRLPARWDPVGPAADEDFADFDDALERITTESEDRERDLIDLTEHTGTPMPEQPVRGPQIITGTVISTPGPAPEFPDVGLSTTSTREGAVKDRPALSGTTAHAPAGSEAPARPGPRRPEAEHTASLPTTPLGPDRPPAASAPHQPDPTSPSALSWTTPENSSTSTNRKADNALAADRISLKSTRTREAAFVRDLEALLRQTGLSFAKLQELAPNGAHLSTLLKGRLPSKPFLKNIIGATAPEELPAWLELWTATVQEPGAAPLQSARTRTRTRVGTRPRTRTRVSATDSTTVLVWAWCCVVLAAGLAYTVTATLTADIQARPGTAVQNLVIYSATALLALFVAAFVLTNPTLMRPKSDKPFFICLVASFLALPGGLIVPWTADINQPWHWIADHLGII